MLIARTDADSATLLTSDVDDADKAFCTGERTPEGFFKVRSGVEVRAYKDTTISCQHMDSHRQIYYIACNCYCK